jgi:hypothetical protein
MPDLNPPVPPEDEQYVDNFIDETKNHPPVEEVAAKPPAEALATPPPESRATLPDPVTPAEPDDFAARVERLGGEPAPVITPEEFVRLQNAGQVHIDAQGRVRTARRAEQADAGVTLRKRRAWYA